MNVLVTGGAGYIASHTNVVLLEAGHNVIAIDNFSNSSNKSIKRVEKITGKPIKFYKGDVRNAKLLDRIFTENKIDAVIHFAGLKAVGESVAKPLLYYNNNIVSTLSLVEAMTRHNVKKLVFSSSATVYGVPKVLPITEDCELSTTNPYGATKLMIENILRDVYAADNSFHIVLLRYFNPVGAHPSGLIGEDPNGVPNNLMPFVAQVASGKRKELNVFGADYDTRDGTGVRDYIHIMDLAEGHLAALKKINKFGCEPINLGTGVGYSVLDMVKAFEKVCHQNVPYKIAPRRAGDIATCYASGNKASKLLGFKTKHNLEDMCADLWNWQSKNPNGYKG